MGRGSSKNYTNYRFKSIDRNTGEVKYFHTQREIAGELECSYFTVCYKFKKGYMGSKFIEDNCLYERLPSPVPVSSIPI